MGKRSNYRRKRFLKAISNYNYGKFSCVYKLHLTTQYFRFTAGAVVAIPFTTILNQSPDFNIYKGLYQSFKICSLLIELVPNMCAPENIPDMQNGSLALSVMTATDGQGFANVVESDSSMIINFNEQRKYVKFPAGLTSWFPLVATAGDPVIVVAHDGLPAAGEFFWSVKFTFYCMFKNKN